MGKMAQNSPMSTSEEYIRAGEAARILRISRKSMTRHAHKIPHQLTPGGQHLYLRSAVVELAERLTKPAREAS